MQMLPGGIDVFYIDESHDQNTYVVTALAIPLLRNAASGWQIAWQHYFDAAKIWRKATVASGLNIPMAKELHGEKLASGRGNFFRGKHNFAKPKAAGVYRQILRSLAFLPDASLMSASVTKTGSLYGKYRLEAAMQALFQRMRTQCSKRNVNAIVFFDQGHPEYRKLYRAAQVYLPTGSSLGSWAGQGPTKSLPLDMFFKDGNEKDSKHCRFTQLADMVAYAAFLKRKGELGQLTPWQQQYSLDSLYNEIPQTKINTAVQGKAPRDGIVRL